MKIALWSLSFVFFVIATITGIGAGIRALPSGWFAVCIFYAAAMFWAAGYADSLDE